MPFHRFPSSFVKRSDPNTSADGLTSTLIIFVSIVSGKAPPQTDKFRRLKSGDIRMDLLKGKTMKNESVGIKLVEGRGC
jgi:hypothetical protein